jgi:TolB-like protein
MYCIPYYFTAMKKYNLTHILCIICFSIILTGTAWGGQVVTEEIRQWANKALEQEKTLETDIGAKTVAILYFNNKTGKTGLDPLQKGLTLMLITDLSTVEGLEVVERVRLQAVTEEMGLGVSGLIDSDTAPRVGRLLGARWLVGGDILEKGQIPIHIDSSVLDVPEPRVLGQPTAEGILEEFFKIEKDLLFKIIEYLQIELAPEEIARLEKPLTTNIKALLDLFKAIHASDRGNYSLAERYYERALKRDPGISPAETYLEELQSLQLTDPVRGKGSELLQALREETSLTDQQTPGITTKREQNPDVDKTPIIIEIPVPPL